MGEAAFDGSGDATVASAEEALDSSEGWRRRAFCGWASIYGETIAHGKGDGGGYGDSQCRASRAGASDGRVRVQDKRALITQLLRQSFRQSGSQPEIDGSRYGWLGWVAHSWRTPVERCDNHVEQRRVGCVYFVGRKAIRLCQP